MAIPAGNFGNPGAGDTDDLESWLPLLLGIGGLAFMFFLGKARGKAAAQPPQPPQLPADPMQGLPMRPDSSPWA